jgi:hypothetical protein
MGIERQHSHLSDEQLLEWYFEHPGDGQTGRPLSPHMAVCRSCAQRYADFARDLDLLRVEGDEAADVVFTPERLAQQRHQVMRRLENHARPADVVVFPTRSAYRLAGRRPAWHPIRWIAAAAVAGLGVGMGLGLSVDRFNSRVGVATPSRSAATTLAQSGPTLSFSSSITVHAPPGDEVESAFLEEIERSLANRRVRELRALDDLTPERVSYGAR